MLPSGINLQFMGIINGTRDRTLPFQMLFQGHYLHFDRDSIRRDIVPIYIMDFLSMTKVLISYVLGHQRVLLMSCS
jgi:hypothetical protein